MAELTRCSNWAELIGACSAAITMGRGRQLLRHLIQFPGRFDVAPQKDSYLIAAAAVFAKMVFF